MTHRCTCDHPMDAKVLDDLCEADLRRAKRCAKPAAVEVRYLGDINYLCAEHHEEASQFNTYQADEVQR